MAHRSTLKPRDATSTASDRQWLEQVFERYEGCLVRYAIRFLHDSERARDVVQDTFLRLCRETNPRETVGSRVAPWLYTVCRNRALDVLKRENRMNPLHDRATTQSGREPDPAAAAQDRDTSCQARSLLAQLPENQQEVVRLKIEHSLSYREIAEITGLTVSNVGNLLHHGLKSIRQKMLSSSEPA